MNFVQRRLKKIFKFLAIFTLIFAWVFSGWPRIWRNPPIPSKIQIAKADTINILPNAIHTNDTTGDTLSGITGDDATEDPDTLSKVEADNVYTVDTGAVMQLDTFDVSSIQTGSTISGAVLHLQYGAEDGYNGTNPVRYDNGGGLTSTGITPTDITGWSADLTYDLYAQGVDTLSELQNVDIEFTSNDGVPPDAIHFDYVWITVTYTPPIISVSLESGSGTVTYGTVVTSQDTTSSGVNQTQTVKNDGNVAEDFDIKGQDSADWTLGATAGSATYEHAWCTSSCDSTPTWNALTTTYDSNYLVSNIAPSSTQDFDLQINVPTSNAGNNQQSVDVFIQATQH